MAILKLGAKILSTAISSIDIWRRTPNQVLEARFKSVLKGSSILWGAAKVAQQMSVRLEIGEGKMDISEIENYKLRKVFEQEGIKQIKMEGWLDVDAVSMIIILKRVAEGMDEGLSYTYNFRSKDPFLREIIWFIKRRSELEIKRRLVERRGAY